MQRRWLASICGLGLAAGCEKKDPPSPPRPPAPDVRLVFGDCAATTALFDSGPRPNPPKPKPVIVPPPEAVAEPAPPPRLAAPAGHIGYTNDEGHMARIGELTASFGIAGLLSGMEADAPSGVAFDAWDDPWGGADGGLGFGAGGLGLKAESGGGGTGWGTIGTGRYGTIGHGSGVGTGYGVGGRGRGLRGSTAGSPNVAMGQPAITGSLDPAIIRRYLRRNAQKVRYCYEKQLLAKSTLHGVVEARFTIGLDGRVPASTASGVDPEVSSCIAAVIQDIEFPRPHGQIEVMYPLTFTSGDPKVDAVAPRPGADLGMAAGSDAGSGTDAAAPVAAAPAQVDAQLDPELAGVRPPSANPFAAVPVDAEVAACVARTTPGVVVVDFTYDASGAVTRASVEGDVASEVRHCIEAAARHAKRKPAAAALTTERCSLAFGTTPPDTAHGIDITDKILFGDYPLDAVATVMADDGTDPKITRLFDVVNEPRSKDPVVVHGPLIVRPADATPIKLVRRVIATLLAARRDFVLAERDGAHWRLLSPVELPVVPVPSQITGDWGVTTSHARDARRDEVILSLRVTRADAWLGVSRVDEHARFAFDQLAAALVTHKRSALLAGRTDLEIAADDDASYGQLARAIDAAVKAGFTSWQLVPRDKLTAHE